MTYGFDDIRGLLPGFGMAAYAYEPHGLVTLELIRGDMVFTFKGRTLQEASRKAHLTIFGQLPAEPTPAPPVQEEPEVSASVFD